MLVSCCGSPVINQVAKVQSQADDVLTETEGLTNDRTDSNSSTHSTENLDGPRLPLDLGTQDGLDDEISESDSSRSSVSSTHTDDETELQKAAEAKLERARKAWREMYQKLDGASRAIFDDDKSEGLKFLDDTDDTDASEQGAKVIKELNEALTENEKFKPEVDSTVKQTVTARTDAAEVDPYKAMKDNIQHSRNLADDAFEKLNKGEKALYRQGKPTDNSIFDEALMEVNRVQEKYYTKMKADFKESRESTTVQSSRSEEEYAKNKPVAKTYEDWDYNEELAQRAKLERQAKLAERDIVDAETELPSSSKIMTFIARASEYLDMIKSGHWSIEDYFSGKLKTAPGQEYDINVSQEIVGESKIDEPQTFNPDNETAKAHEANERNAARLEMQAADKNLSDAKRNYQKEYGYLETEKNAQISDVVRAQKEASEAKIKELEETAQVKSKAYQDPINKQLQELAKKYKADREKVDAGREATSSGESDDEDAAIDTSTRGKLKQAEKELSDAKQATLGYRFDYNTSRYNDETDPYNLERGLGGWKLDVKINDAQAKNDHMDKVVKEQAESLKKAQDYQKQLKAKNGYIDPAEAEKAYFSSKEIISKRNLHDESYAQYIKRFNAAFDRENQERYFNKALKAVAEGKESRYDKVVKEGLDKDSLNKLDEAGNKKVRDQFDAAKKQLAENQTKADDAVKEAEDANNKANENLVAAQKELNDINEYKEARNQASDAVKEKAKEVKALKEKLSKEMNPEIKEESAYELSDTDKADNARTLARNNLAKEILNLDAIKTTGTDKEIEAAEQIVTTAKERLRLATKDYNNKFKAEMLKDSGDELSPTQASAQAIIDAENAVEAGSKAFRDAHSKIEEAKPTDTEDAAGLEAVKRSNESRSGNKVNIKALNEEYQARVKAKAALGEEPSDKIASKLYKPKDDGTGFEEDTTTVKVKKPTEVKFNDEVKVDTAGEKSTVTLDGKMKDEFKGRGDRANRLNAQDKEALKALEDKEEYYKKEVKQAHDGYLAKKQKFDDLVSENKNADDIETAQQEKDDAFDDYKKLKKDQAEYLGETSEKYDARVKKEITDEAIKLETAIKERSIASRKSTPSVKGQPKVELIEGTDEVSLRSVQDDGVKQAEIKAAQDEIKLIDQEYETLENVKDSARLEELRSQNTLENDSELIDLKTKFRNLNDRMTAAQRELTDIEGEQNPLNKPADQGIGKIPESDSSRFFVSSTHTDDPSMSGLIDASEHDTESDADFRHSDEEWTDHEFRHSDEKKQAEETQEPEKKLSDAKQAKDDYTHPNIKELEIDYRNKKDAYNYNGNDENKRLMNQAKTAYEDALPQAKSDLEKQFNEAFDKVTGDNKASIDNKAKIQKAKIQKAFNKFIEDKFNDEKLDYDFYHPEELTVKFNSDKTEVTFNVKVRGGSDSGGRIIEREQTIDIASGNKVEDVSTAPNGSKTVMKFDSKTTDKLKSVKLKSVTTDKFGKETNRYEYNPKTDEAIEEVHNYDKEGNPVSESKYKIKYGANKKETPTLISKSDYEYDLKTQKLTEKTKNEYAKDGKTLEKSTVNEYAKDGVTIKKTTVNEYNNGKIYLSTENEFYKDGKTLKADKIKKYNKDGTIDTLTEGKYRENVKDAYEANTEKYKYVTNEKNELTKTTNKQNYKNERWCKEIETIDKYAADGKTLEMSTKNEYAADGKTLEKKTAKIYEYDSSGKLTTATKYGYDFKAGEWKELR